MIKKIIAILLLVFAIFGKGALDLLDITPPAPEPKPTEILNIDKPSQEVIDRVKQFSDIITDPTDRAKIAIFNYQFAQNILSYEANVQQVNDVYVLAGKNFFQNSIANKYEPLDQMIIKLLEDIIGSENHALTESEKLSLHKYFNAIAWVLIQKV